MAVEGLWPEHFNQKTKPMTKSISLLASIAVLAPCLTVATHAATQVYDLKADWSDTQNPNGPWSFRDSVGGLFVNTPCPWWNSAGGDAITKLTEASVLPGYEGSIVEPGSLEVGDVVLVAFVYTSVRWTAPLNGIINISGALWPRENPQFFPLSWTLTHNGNPVSDGLVGTGIRSSPYDLSSGSGGADGLLNISVQAGDQVELRLHTSGGAIGLNVTITLASDSGGCPNASFAEDTIIWHQPLARNGASEDTDPSTGRTVKYRFKRGSTIPIQIHALNCAGADVTSNANVIGKVTVFGDSNCDGAADGNGVPIEFNGVGGGGGVMDKIGGHLKYNLDTKSLPTTTQCYILRVTVTDTSTGEEKFEEVLLQAK